MVILVEKLQHITRIYVNHDTSPQFWENWGDVLRFLYFGVMCRDLVVCRKIIYIYSAYIQLSLCIHIQLLLSVSHVYSNLQLSHMHTVLSTLPINCEFQNLPMDTCPTKQFQKSLSVCV